MMWIASVERERQSYSEMFVLILLIEVNFGVIMIAFVTLLKGNVVVVMFFTLLIINFLLI
jgi:hypothetical protein